jgi:hypothetical protein
MHMHLGERECMLPHCRRAGRLDLLEFIFLFCFSCMQGTEIRVDVHAGVTALSIIMDLY